MNLIEVRRKLLDDGFFVFVFSFSLPTSYLWQSRFLRGASNMYSYLSGSRGEKHARLMWFCRDRLLKIVVSRFHGVLDESIVAVHLLKMMIFFSGSVIVVFWMVD